MKLWCVSLCCVCLLLLSAPWKTVEPMSEVSRCKLCGCPDGPDYGDPHECPPGFKVSPPPPTVPRVARSVDDLRVGMVVAWYSRDTESWDVYEHDETTTLRDRSTYRDGEPFFAALDAGQVFILADPPARDWLVPATQMEALREALNVIDRLTASIPAHERAAADLMPKWNGPGPDVVSAARAVLDAAREVEHE